jgi:thiosulfate dehydrogenase
MLAGLALAVVAKLSVGQQTGPDPAVWTVPEIGALPNDAHGRLVRRGRDLITATYALIGPLAANPAKRYAGNNLACGSCHLQAATKMFGLPLFGLAGDYPRYNARSGTEITLVERLNACMTRSMNGRPLPANSPEMTAIVTYLQFLSTGVPPGRSLPGLGSGDMPELGRAANPGRGRHVYAESCAACHNADGSGFPRIWLSANPGYMVPPLWGPDSFNNGAGMNRLIAAANFVHTNMPAGTDYLAPRLAPDDAWDVAAFMVSQPRPQKPGLDKDFPDLLSKPVDTPYGPYADSFGEQQHKYGPFAPIRAMLARLKAETPGGRTPPRPAGPADTR